MQLVHTEVIITSAARRDGQRLVPAKIQVMPMPRGRCATKVESSLRSVMQTQARTMFAMGLGIARV
jgi:hypothetical protein